MATEDTVLSRLIATLQKFFETEGGLEGKEIATPEDNPDSGRRRIYPKTDGWYEQDDAGAEARLTNVNADWDASSGDAEILNKPDIPAAQVNSDWNASGTVAEILNKPATMPPSAHGHAASEISASTIAFTGNLSSADDTVQKALDTLDDLVVSVPDPHRVSVNQTGHGLSVGNAIYRTTGSAYAKAQADTSAKAEVIGVVETVTNEDNFVYILPGGVITLSGLTDGAAYWLSPATAGLLTTSDTDETTYIDKPVLVAISTTQAIVVNYRGIKVSGTSSSSVGSNGAAGGRLAFVSTTLIKYEFTYDNVLSVYNNSQSLWKGVQPPSEISAGNTSYDMCGNVLAAGVNYDVYAKYVSDTEYSLEFAPWGASGIASSAVAIAWATGQDAKVGWRRTNSGATYACIANHTTGTFATDLAAGYWVEVEDDGLGRLDGIRVYANSGDFRNYRFLGCVRLITGPYFAWDEHYRNIWNYYNRKPFTLRATNTTSSWQYSTDTLRESNGGTGQQRGCFIGREILIRPHVGMNQICSGGGGAVGGQVYGLIVGSSGTVSDWVIACRYYPTSAGTTAFVARGTVDNDQSEMDIFGLGYNELTTAEQISTGTGNFTGDPTFDFSMDLWC